MLNCPSNVSHAICAPLRLSLSCLAPLIVVLIPVSAGAQSDNFNDGKDAGWTHYDPLAQVGGTPAQYTFPNGAYQITASGTPDPSFGPGRAGSLRNDVTYNTFQTGVDLVGWDSSHDQAIGILARITNPGLGTTDGYAFTYSTVGHSIDLSRINGESPSGLGSTSITLDPTHTYRLVMTGDGPSLTGQIFDTTDLTTPLASISATDSAFAQGVNGLVVFDNTSAGTLGATGTFDNYLATATVPEPSALALLGAGALLWVRRARITPRACS